MLPRSSRGTTAQVMWKRPYLSVVATSPRAVATRTPGRPRSPSSCMPLRLASSKTLPSTSVQSKVGSGTTRTVAEASPDSGAPVTLLNACARVHELALADPGADREQQAKHAATRATGADVGPDEPAAVERRLDLHAVDLRGSLHVAESGGEAVQDAEVRDHHAGLGREDDLVGHQRAAADVDRRRRLGDADEALEQRVERNVVVEDLARARRLAAVEQQVQVVVRTRGAGRHRRRRSELRGLRFAVQSRWTAPRRRRCPGRWVRRAAPSRRREVGGMTWETPAAKFDPGGVTAIR